MTSDPEPEKIGRSGPRLESEIKVVDLSERPSALTPLHRKILDALGRAVTGIMSRDELLEEARGYSFSDVERALRDLSLRGLVKVLWRSPFRFMAFSTESGVRSDERPLAAPVGLPG